MTDTPSAAEHEPAVQLDVDRLDCYQATLQLQVVLPALTQRSGRSLRDQLDRASASVLLNLAEGCGRRAPKDRAHFYSIARGSAMECAGAVDIIAVRGRAPLVACRQARCLLVRVVGMLTKLEQEARNRRA